MITTNPHESHVPMEKELESIPALMAMATKWFTPSHLQEVIEERANDGYCGWPYCCQPIAVPTEGRVVKIGTFTTLQMSNLSLLFRELDYKSKRLMAVGESKFFCSSSCLEAASIFRARLDETTPTLRKIDAPQLPDDGVGLDGFIAGTKNLRLSVCLYVCMYVCMHFSFFLSLSIYVPICLFLYQSVYLSAFL